jgi:hypothetical protein
MKRKHGEYRITERFLLLPATDFSGETRWLEKARFFEKLIGVFLIFPLWSGPYHWADGRPLRTISSKEYNHWIVWGGEL